MKPIKQGSAIVKNSAMLMAMNIAKIIFPLLSLPYLTRVLSTDCYGSVVYVKSIIAYLQILVDFGFMLSATKEIVRAQNDKAAQEKVVGDVLLARLWLAGGALAVLLVLIATLPILQACPLLSLLSFVPVFLTLFLFDFLFRGLEQMESIALRFVVMRGIATVLTFVLIHSDADVLLIPLLDTFGGLIAALMAFAQVRRLGVHVYLSRDIAGAWNMLKDSAVYFVSNVASMSFSALNTLLLGIILTTQEVAYWGVCIQALAAVQALYTPITDSLYPVMVRERELRRIKKMVKLFLPLVLVGCVATYFLADFGIVLIGGEDYAPAASIFRYLIPVLFFSFFALLFGWPTLGAIDCNAETSRSTVYALFFQVVGLLALLCTGCYSLVAVALLRSATEAVLCTIRIFYIRKNISAFTAMRGTLI